MMTENYSGGTIDVSWQTAPWNQDGETIPKETENQEGDITMTELPEEVDADSLSDMQEEIIRTAVRNLGFSSAQLDEVADCSAGYAARTLRNEAPQWYNTVFKNNGKSTEKTRNDLLEDDEDADYPHPEELESVADETEDGTDYKRKTIPATDSTKTSNSSAEADGSEWQSYVVVGLLSFVLGLLVGGRND